jgi:hypothetical protein
VRRGRPGVASDAAWGPVGRIEFVSACGCFLSEQEGGSQMMRGQAISRNDRILRRSLLAALAALLLPIAALAELAVGDPAPNFTLQGSDGARYELKSLLASGQGVVLAWFPKAFTPG